MVGLPKKFKKIARKLDIRVHPDPEKAKLFNPECGRRYINVALNMISFFDGVADKVDDDSLKEYAEKIRNAAYTQDGVTFDEYTKLYKERLGSLGLWRSTKGISTYQKVKILAKLRKVGKIAKQQQEEEEKMKKDKEHQKKQSHEPYRDRGDY